MDHIRLQSNQTLLAAILEELSDEALRQKVVERMTEIDQAVEVDIDTV